jgi:hypothetical protein
VHRRGLGNGMLLFYLQFFLLFLHCMFRYYKQHAIQAQRDPGTPTPTTHQHNTNTTHAGFTQTHTHDLLDVRNAFIMRVQQEHNICVGAINHTLCTHPRCLYHNPYMCPSRDLAGVKTTPDAQANGGDRTGTRKPARAGRGALSANAHRPPDNNDRRISLPRSRV